MKHLIRYAQIFGWLEVGSEIRMAWRSAASGAACLAEALGALLWVAASPLIALYGFFWPTTLFRWLQALQNL